MNTVDLSSKVACVTGDASRSGRAKVAGLAANQIRVAVKIGGARLALQAPLLDQFMMARPTDRLLVGNPDHDGGRFGFRR